MLGGGKMQTQNSDFHNFLINLDQTDSIELYRYSHNVVNTLRQFFKDDDIDGFNTQIEYEIIVFELLLQKGDIKRHSLSVSTDGKKLEYPIITDEKAFLEYLIVRLGECRNPILKAKYSHIIWKFNKHEDYGVISVNEYIRASEIFKAFDSSEDKWGLDYLNSIENAYYINKSISVSKRITLSNVIIDAIKSYSNDSSSFFAIRASLLEIIIKYFKEFNNHIRKDVIEYLYEFGNLLIDKKRLHNAITIFEQGKKISLKSKFDEINWDERIAQTYELLIVEMGDAFPSIDFCRNAIEHYKLAKNVSKKTEMEKKYEEISSNLKFNAHEFKMNIKPVVDYAKALTKEALKLSTSDLLDVLTFDKELLPKYSEISLMTDKTMKDSIHHLLANTVVFDSRGNEVMKVDTDEEKRNYEMINNYGIALSLKEVVFNMIILESIKTGKLTYESFYYYFIQRSWIGTQLEINIGTGGKLQYSWLKQVCEPINFYINQMSAYYSSNRKAIPSVILCIDSLTIKIEGLLRDILTLNNIPTVYHTTDNSGRKISREKEINVLIREPQLQSIFDDDELLLFKYVLIEQNGINLRNKVCHALIYEQEYQYTLMNLLIIIVLRLGKYVINRPI